MLSVHIAATHTRPHLLSAACRSAQFVTSVNNVVSQRDLRSVSCVVDVDWLKVWVQLLVMGRDEDYRVAQLNRLFVAWIEMKP